jgi:dodecin
VSDHVYSIDEIVGSSTESIDDAIRKAVRSTAQTKRNVEWFTTEEIRGHVVDGEVGHFQVTLKVGFRLDDPQ